MCEVIEHLILLVPLPDAIKYSERVKSQTEQQGNMEGINLISKTSTMPISVFLSFSLGSPCISVSFSIFLIHHLIPPKSNCITLNVAGHLVPPGLLFLACQKIQWLMTHDVLVKLPVFGQIILKISLDSEMAPLIVVIVAGASNWMHWGPLGRVGGEYWVSDRHVHPSCDLHLRCMSAYMFNVV